MRVRALLVALVVIALAVAAQIAVSHSHAHTQERPLTPVSAQPSIGTASASSTNAPHDAGLPETEGLCSAVVLTGLVLPTNVQAFITHRPMLLPRAPAVPAPLAVAAADQQRRALTPLASMTVCRQ